MRHYREMSTVRYDTLERVSSPSLGMVSTGQSDMSTSSAGNEHRVTTLGYIGHGRSLTIFHGISERAVAPDYVPADHISYDVDTMIKTQNFTLDVNSAAYSAYFAEASEKDSHTAATSGVSAMPPTSLPGAETAAEDSSLGQKSRNSRKNGNEEQQLDRVSRN